MHLWLPFLAILSFPTLAGTSWNKLCYLKGCDLQLPGGKWQSFPGNYCIFLDDGSFITWVDKKIKRFHADKSVMWEKPFSVHHQMNLTPDGKRILVLAEEVRKQKDKIIRDDVFVILDLEGNVVKKQGAFEILESAKLPSLMTELNEPSFENSQFESSHFNSIYEIPENVAKNKLTWAKPGNIIVNSLRLGIYVLSPDLSKVLHHEKFPFSRLHRVHDVQLNKDGQILLFNNVVEGKSRLNHSAAQKYDPVKKTITFEFTSTPKEMFYSPQMGSVQEVDGVYVIGHMAIGGFVYSPKEKKILDTSPAFTNPVQGIRFQQQVKLVDVQKFLSAQQSAR